MAEVTVLDVLENHFGAYPSTGQITSLTAAEIDTLGELVRESADANIGVRTADAYYQGGFIGRHWYQVPAEHHVYTALLYYPRLLVHDPLAEFFFDRFDLVPAMRPLRASGSSISVEDGPAVWGRNNTWVQHRHDLDHVRSWLAGTVQALEKLAPLIRSGALILRSQWPTIVDRQQQLLTSVARDVKSEGMQAIVRHALNSGEHLPVWDYLWGMHVSVGQGIDPRDLPWQNQNEFFYLAKTLAIADSAGATYVPPTAAELELLRAKALQVASKLPRLMPTRLLEEVTNVLVPDLRLTPDLLIAMRASEADFEDWRRQLRGLAREASGDDPDGLRERVEDELLPIRDRIRRATTGSAILSAALGDPATFTISGAVGVAAAIPDGAPLVAAASVLGTGVLQWLWKAYRAPRLGGSEAVIAALTRKPSN